jgi:hypothetical protein
VSGIPDAHRLPSLRSGGPVTPPPADGSGSARSR